MNTVLFYMLEIVVIAAIVIITRYIVPALHAYIANSKYAWIANVIADAVDAAEQTVKEEKSGAKKKAMVLDMIEIICKEAQISITQDQIDSLIESAVFAMNNGEKK